MQDTMPAAALQDDVYCTPPTGQMRVSWHVAVEGNRAWIALQGCMLRSLR